MVSKYELLQMEIERELFQKCKFLLREKIRTTLKFIFHSVAVPLIFQVF